MLKKAIPIFELRELDEQEREQATSAILHFARRLQRAAFFYDAERLEIYKGDFSPATCYLFQATAIANLKDSEELQESLIQDLKKLWE